MKVTSVCEHDSYSSLLFSIEVLHNSSRYLLACHSKEASSFFFLFAKVEQQPSIRRKKPNELQSLKSELSYLLTVFEGEGIFIPPVQEQTRKAFRTRGAGNAQNKKQERKKDELTLVKERVTELKAILQEKGVEF